MNLDGDDGYDDDDGDDGNDYDGDYIDVEIIFRSANDVSWQFKQTCFRANFHERHSTMYAKRVQKRAALMNPSPHTATLIGKTRCE